MPKVAQSVLDDFGRALKRARSLKGWQLDQLSRAMEGANASRSYLSNLEKGQRQISPPTVGRLIKALDLDEGWIDKFLDADIAQEAEETAVDRTTERLLALQAKDAQTPDAAEDLLILLANTHAQGQYTDIQTAYQALRGALEAADRLRERGTMRGNLDDQLNDVMAEVMALNARGEVEEANDLLDNEEKRMIAAHRAERDRQHAAMRSLLQYRIDQDRLRNDPTSAAKRLIEDLRRQALPVGLFQATHDLLSEWRERGEVQGDPFELRVALALAKMNREKARRGQEGYALSDLGVCHLAIGERAADDRHLISAEKAVNAAIKEFPKREAPMNWAVEQNNLGLALRQRGERTKDESLLRAAVTAHENALTVWSKETTPTDWARSRNNLGTALQSLGEFAGDDTLLRAAVAALEDALTVWTRTAEPMLWAAAQNNLGLALRWRCTVADDPALFDDAEAAYLRCLEEWRQDTEPFYWATTQWNLADLALARHALSPSPTHLTQAEHHARAARAVFADRSDHQTDRCDDLLRQIAAAREPA